MPGVGRVLEFGAGRSTVWFAGKGARVLSVETDPVWAVRVGRWLDDRGLAGRVEIRLSADPVGVVGDFGEGKVDLVLVDGVRRDECLAAVLPLLREGGWLVLDNINRYIPCDCRGPGSVRDWSQTTLLWRRLAKELQVWEGSWEDDGVSATWLLRRPGGCGECEKKVSVGLAGEGLEE